MHLKQFRFRGNLVFCLLLKTQTTFGGRWPAEISFTSILERFRPLEAALPIFGLDKLLLF